MATLLYGGLTAPCVIGSGKRGLRAWAESVEHADDSNPLALDEYSRTMDRIDELIEDVPTIEGSTGKFLAMTDGAARHMAMVLRETYETFAAGLRAQGLELEDGVWKRKESSHA